MSRPCLDCGTVTPDSVCPTCRAIRQRVRDAARGTTTQRGYGAAHQAERRRWQIRMARETVLCARCHHPIEMGQAWDLDHDDSDRSQHLGPSHADCNRGAARRK